MTAFLRNISAGMPKAWSEPYLRVQRDFYAEATVSAELVPECLALPRDHEPGVSVESPVGDCVVQAASGLEPLARPSRPDRRSRWVSPLRPTQKAAFAAHENFSDSLAEHVAIKG